MTPRMLAQQPEDEVSIQGDEETAAGVGLRSILNTIMWFGAFPGAFGLGRAQPQRRQRISGTASHKGTKVQQEMAQRTDHLENKQMGCPLLSVFSLLSYPLNTTSANYI